MKKLAAAVSMALLLSLAAPAFAAVEISGTWENKLELSEVQDKWQVNGETGIDVKTTVTGENGQTIKGVVELGFKAGLDDDDELDGTLPFDNLLEGFSLADIAVEKAWIESEGPFWNGGPSVMTKIGDVGVEWNPVVAQLDELRGVSVEGLTMGPATARAFYLWDGADRPFGLQASGAVDGVDVSALVVRNGSENNFLLDAGTRVIPGINVSGQLALDGENHRLYRVEAEADNIVNGVKVTVGYRGADDDFAPMYTIQPEDEDGNPVGRNDADNIHYDLLDGFNVAVETVQSGVRLMADYDHPHEMVNLEADTELHGFNIGYAAKIKKDEDIEHKVKAKTVINAIEAFQGLGVSAEMKLVGDDLTWEAGADYTAPNGLDLGLKYHSEDGPSATAGVTVNF